MADCATFKELGNARYKQGKYQEAVDAYTQAIEADPTEPTFFGNRAAALMMLKKFDEALSDCKAATSLDASFVKGYLRAAKCYSQRGMLWEAKDMISKVSQRDPANAEAAKELVTLDQVEKDMAEATLKLKANDYDRASYFVDRILPICPDAPSVLGMRAELLIGRKKFDDAASITWALLAKDRNNPDLLFLRGKALLYGGQTDQAMKHFQESLRVDPDHARAREGLKGLKNMEKAKTAGNDAFKEGRCEEAIASYTEALGYDHLNTMYNSTIYCNRAAARMKIKQYKEALADCEESIKLNEGYIKAYTRKAECLIQLEEFETAVQVLEATLKLDPDSRDLKQRIRDAKLELKKSKRKDYYKILEISKDASESEIKKAYKRAALKSHPDKCQDSSEVGREAAERAFKDVGEAYSVLSDSQKRHRYDAGQDLEEIEGGGCGHHHEMDPNAIFQMFMNQGGFGGMGGGGGGGREFHFG